MKLYNLLEDENPPEELKDQYRRGNEKFIQTLFKYKKEHMVYKKFQIPEGEVHTSVDLDTVPYTWDRYKNEKFLGHITLRIDFMPKMDPKPEIPLNILQVAVIDFVDSLKAINPDLFNKPSLYPVDLLDCYHLKIQNVSIFPGQAIFQLRDYMETPTYNMKLQAPNKFGGIMLSRSYLLNTYKLNEGDLPTFSDDYTTAMAKLVKKAKSVYNAMRKGTWKGHSYELFKPHDWSRAFVVHQDKFNYNRADKVLRPSFDITCNFGYETVDGVKNSPAESPLTQDEQREFQEYLKKRFRNFNIGY
jgi:hypothetical protein